MSGFRKVVYMVTKKMFLEKRAIEIEKRREDSATRIQTAFRRHHARSEFKVAKKGVIELQAAFRGKKVRKHIKINRAVNIVEEKKRLEEDSKRQKERIAQLEADLAASETRAADLDSRNNELSGTLVATTDQLNATRASKKKVPSFLVENPPFILTLFPSSSARSRRRTRRWPRISRTRVPSWRRRRRRAPRCRRR